MPGFSPATARTRSTAGAGRRGAASVRRSGSTRRCRATRRRSTGRESVRSSRRAPCTSASRASGSPRAGAARARVRRSMLMPAVRELRVIPFGVDLDVFRAADRAERAAARAALGLDPSRAVFLVFANALRARTWKDSFAFRGAPERRRGSAASAQWVALGETGPDEQVGGVRVRFAGFETDDRRLARWYQAADAYVHPSRADTFPQMVVESLACGTPVIATDVGGIPEQIASASFLRGARPSARVDTATGALVPAGDAGALAHAIAAVAELDAERRAALSANAARDARARFDRRAHAREYLDWIRSVAAARADASGSATPGAARGSL